MTGTVTLGAKSYTVTVMSETPKKSEYRVTCNSLRAKTWRPGLVTIGVECVFVCLTCRMHSGNPCVHIEIVRRFVASQPLEVVEVSNG